MKKKHELGLPVTRPRSSTTFPGSCERSSRNSTSNSAREVGQMLLDDGNIPQAWIYFRTIQEPEAGPRSDRKTGQARSEDPQYDEILQLALYEGANP
jgi:hypothetical protein